MRHCAFLRPGIDTVQLRTKCPHCVEHYWVDVSKDAYIRWISGEPIQLAFPEMSGGDRERLITGYCPEYWSSVFEEDEEEDEWSPDTLNR